MEIKATEKNKHILAHYLDLANKNYKGLPPEKEIIAGSFLASENSQEFNASNSVQRVRNLPKCLINMGRNKQMTTGGVKFFQIFDKLGGKTDRVEFGQPRSNSVCLVSLYKN